MSESRLAAARGFIGSPSGGAGDAGADPRPAEGAVQHRGDAAPDGDRARGAAPTREDPQEPGPRPDADRRRGDRADDGHGLGGDRDDRGRDRRRLRRQPGRRRPQGRRAGAARHDRQPDRRRRGRRERRADLRARRMAAGGEVGVLVEIDVGLHRAGVRGVEPAAELAQLVEGLAGAAASRAVRLRGPLHARARPRGAGPQSEGRQRAPAGARRRDGTARALDRDRRRRRPRHLGHHRRQPADHRDPRRLLHLLRRLPPQSRPRLRPGADGALEDHLPPWRDGGARQRPQVDRDRPGAAGAGRRGRRGPLRTRRAFHPRGAHRGRARGRRPRSRRHRPADARLLADHGQFLRLLLRRRGWAS